MCRALILTVFLSALVFALPSGAIAAESPAYNPRQEIIMDMNRIAAAQNPKFEKTEKILGRRILDRKNKVVGIVNDVVLNENGNISFLDVEFDRMQLSRSVLINYGTLNIEPVTNGYAMTFDSKEIEKLYPSLLADIETAAGDDEAYSLKKLAGMEVWTTGGRRIGKIDDVLFGSNGQRAEALYVGLSINTMHNKAVAMPFGDADFSKAIKLRRVVIPDDMADAMIAFAQGK